MTLGRREFITLLGSTAAAWPLAARAQQRDRRPRVGVLMAYDQSDPVAKAYLSEFTLGLAELGWTDGGNLRMDLRWAAGNVDRMRMFAKELLDLQPDVILAQGTPATAAFQRETRTIVPDSPPRLIHPVDTSRLKAERVAPGRVFGKGFGYLHRGELYFPLVRMDRTGAGHVSRGGPPLRAGAR
jgi:hypothetical protein